MIGTWNINLQSSLRQRFSFITQVLREEKVREKLLFKIKACCKVWSFHGIIREGSSLQYLICLLRTTVDISPRRITAEVYELCELAHWQSTYFVYLVHVFFKDSQSRPAVKFALGQSNFKSRYESNVIQSANPCWDSRSDCGPCLIIVFLVQGAVSLSRRLSTVTCEKISDLVNFMKCSVYNASL